VESKYFRKKAAQCRRLAANIVGDPTAEALLRLAEEFEAKAARRSHASAMVSPTRSASELGRRSRGRRGGARRDEATVVLALLACDADHAAENKAL
jgi:hypothetical protein